MTSSRGPGTISTIAARHWAVSTRKKIPDPKRGPSFAPGITKPDTPSEYITTAVPMVVGGESKLRTLPPIEIGWRPR